MGTARSFTESAGHAAFAEVAYVHDGLVLVESVLPLRWGDRPALALTYAREDLAARLAAARDATLVLSDSRMALKGWQPIAAAVRLEVIEDPDGQQFELEGLLGQELVKYPPSRQLADTPLLRRENWWYRPRLLVRVADIGRVWSVARRTGDGALVAARVGGQVDADTVAVEDWGADALRLRSLAGRALGDLDSVAACLYRHDFAIPDLDRQVAYLVQGPLDGGVLRARERTGSRELGGPPGLLRRLRAQRDLERACCAGLRARGHD